MTPTLSPVTRTGDFQPVIQVAEGEDVKAPRYVFFAGDWLTPQQKMMQPVWKPRGGFLHTSRCLIVTQGFIERGRIVPVVEWYEAMIPMRAGEMRRMLRPLSEYGGRDVQEFVRDGNTYGFPPRPGTDASLMALPKYPGNEIRSITGIGIGENNALPVGIVEINALRGHDRQEDAKLIAHLETKIFGTPEEVAAITTLREFRQRIQAVRPDNQFEAQAQEAGLTSCDLYRTAAVSVCETVNALLRVGVQPNGFTWTKTPVFETLCQMVEIRPADDFLNEQQRSGQEQTAILGRMLDQMQQSESVRLLHDELAQMRVQSAQQQEQIQRLLDVIPKDLKEPKGKEPKNEPRS